MTVEIGKLALLAAESDAAQETAELLRSEGDFVDIAEADAAVVLGGDGFMLQQLHAMLDERRVISAFGLNLGTVGFLMNRIKRTRPLIERVARAQPVAVKPLCMRAHTQSGETREYHAINEVSLLRETRQTAKLEVHVNGRKRIGELSADGVLVATPAGSTAYNFSANGPILPLTSNLLALTPISPFRPRRWRGAILPDHYEIGFRVIDPDKRPVAAVADQKELRDIDEVTVSIDTSRTLTLLFDKGQTLEERIVAEQFVT